MSEQENNTPDVNDSKPEESGKRWYVARIATGAEKQVLQSLEEHIALAGMEDKFGEIMVPTEEVVEMRSGKRRKSTRRFFPGYMLINMEMSEDAWHLIKKVTKVFGFVGGTSDRPAPISQKEVDAILERMQEGVDKPKPKTLYEPGEMVRVIDGPFADFDGVVEDVNYEKSRLRVSVLIFGRSTPVELEFSQVDKS